MSFLKKMIKEVRSRNFILKYIRNDGKIYLYNSETKEHIQIDDSINSAFEIFFLESVPDNSNAITGMYDKNVKPISLSINSTNFCVKGCSFCYCEDILVTNKKQEILVNFDNVLRIVNDRGMKLNDFKEVVILGGEPLENNQLIIDIDRAIENTPIFVSTAYFKQDKLEELNCTQNVELQYSLSSYKDYSDFKKIEHLIKVPYTVKLLLSNTFHEVTGIIEDIGYDRVEIILPYGENVEIVEDIAYFNNLEHLIKTAKTPIKFLTKGSHVKNGCEVIKGSSINIDYTGEVIACESNVNMSKELANKISEDICRNCSIFNICGSSCPTMISDSFCLNKFTELFGSLHNNQKEYSCSMK